MGWRVLATTTTTIETEQLNLLPRALSPDVGSQIISQALTEDKFVFLHGLPPRYIDYIHADVASAGPDLDAKIELCLNGNRHQQTYNQKNYTFQIMQNLVL